MKNTIATSVSEVTIFEDRAHVKRTGKIKINKGNNYYVAEDIAPVLVNKTLNVKLENCGNSKIISVYIKRSYKILNEDKPDKIKEYDNLLSEINEDLKKLKHEDGYLDKSISELNDINNDYMNELSEDLAWGLDHTGFLEALEKLIKNKDKYHKQKQDIFWQLKKKNKKAFKLKEQINRLYSPSVIKKADVVINIDSSDEEDAGIEIEYLVPGACWRPSYTARLKNKKLGFECFGTVWQNTGEDWENAGLFFSTERPSLGTETPRLSSDILTLKKRDDEIIVAAREQEVQTTGLGKPKKVDMPGIDDGGDICIFKSSMKADIPSDGRPYNVKIFNFEESAETRLVLIPELEEAVILEVCTLNSSKYPLLAGPVDLIKDYGKTGRTCIMYVSPGEKFKIGFGPDNEISVKRIFLKKELKKKVLSSYTVKEYSVTVKTSNTGDTEKEINLQERIPVSEIEKLKIEYYPDEGNENTVPDENGILNRKIKLKPYEKNKLAFKYRIHKHNSIANFPV